MIVCSILIQIQEYKPFYPHIQSMNVQENKGRPSEKKLPVVVVYKKPTGKLHYMMITESSVDEVLDNSKRKPLIPNNYEIVDMGIGESFIKSFKKQYNIK
jgi:hypothetical protein